MKTETEPINQFMSDLQQFLDQRGASIFFGEHYGEIWAHGERIGAVTHTDSAELEIHKCDC